MKIMIWFQSALAIAFLSPAYADDNGKSLGIDGKLAGYEEVYRQIAKQWQEQQSVAATNKPATMSMSEIRQGVLDSVERVEAIYVSFNYQLDRKFKSVADLRAESAQKMVPDNFSIDMSGAIKGSKMYLKSKELPDGRANLLAFNGRETKSLQTNTLEGTLNPTRDPNSMAMFRTYLYPLSLAVGLSNDVAEFKESEEYIPTLLTYEAHLRVEPRLQEVDGFECHVISSKMGRIWIDVNSGFCVRRWIQFVVASTRHPTVPALVIMNQDFKVVGDGVALPFLCRHVGYATHSEPPERFGEITRTVTLTVEEININDDLSDGLFDFEFPEGCRLVDTARKRIYYVAKGDAALEQAIRDGAEIADDGTLIGAERLFATAPNAGDVQIGKRSWWFWGNLALVAALLMFVVVGRFKQPK